MGASGLRPARKEWDTLTRSQQLSVIRQYEAEVRCPECSGPFKVIDGHTHLIHKWSCSVPTRFHRLVRLAQRYEVVYYA